MKFDTKLFYSGKQFNATMLFIDGSFDSGDICSA